MNNILAKSNGVTLLNHSRNIAKLSIHIAKNYLGVNDKELEDLIYYSGLLHDIGKSYSEY